MNIETLLGMSADELEKMSNEQLEAYCEPFFKVTRPELAPRPMATTKQNTVVATKQFHAKAALLKAQGIDVDFLLKKKKY